jgi:hypothetical protein
MEPLQTRHAFTALFNPASAAPAHPLELRQRLVCQVTVDANAAQVD